MKRISILGSTGSIGRQSLAVVDAHSGQFEVVALAAGSNVKLAAEQTIRHRPKVVSVGTEDGSRELCDILKAHDRNRKRLPNLIPKFCSAAEGMERVATHPDAEMVISAPSAWSVCRQRTKPSNSAKRSAWQIKKSWSPPEKLSWRQ